MSEAKADNIIADAQLASIKNNINANTQAIAKCTSLIITLQAQSTQITAGKTATQAIYNSCCAEKRTLLITAIGEGKTASQINNDSSLTCHDDEIAGCLRTIASYDTQLTQVAAEIQKYQLKKTSLENEVTTLNQEYETRLAELLA